MKKYHFKEIDSTSTYLKENYLKFDNLTFVSSDFQKNGHGRNNRKWISNSKENLLFSVLIKDKELIKRYSSISLSTAVCVYKMLLEMDIKNIKIKWPNDVFVNDKKIAGILLESVSFGNEIEAIILGIGINVNSLEFENDLLNVPTSIYKETNKKTCISKVKRNMYKKIKKMLLKSKKDDKEYLKIIRQNNYLKDKEVYASINGKKQIIKVIDINEDNSLRIDIDGNINNINSGEITFHL